MSFSLTMMSFKMGAWPTLAMGSKESTDRHTCHRALLSCALQILHFFFFYKLKLVATLPQGRLTGLCSQQAQVMLSIF